jgi:hypothetical protein
MKFLANEKLTLYTSLDEFEVLEILKQATEPAQPLVPIIHGEKPFIGTIAGPFFEITKRNRFFRGFLSLQIQGKVESNGEGSIISIQIKLKKLDLLVVTVNVVVLALWIFFSVESISTGSIQFGSEVSLFLGLAFIIALWNLFQVFRGINEPQKTFRVFCELLQAHETAPLE